MGLFNIKDIDIIITRYLENKCTKEEKQQLYELLASSDYERLYKEGLFSDLSEFREDQHEKHIVDFDRIYNQLLSEIKQRETKESEKRLLQNKTRISKVRRLVLQGILTAAVFCIAFLFGYLFNRNHGEITPGLFVTNTFNEIKAPLGAKSEVKLTDGTEVMLNAGSSIKYRSDYNSLNRDIILEGEAYFKAARNIDIPLVVHAGNLNIKATGTEFNVKAYSDEGIIETTLIEGKIEISQTGDTLKEQILILEPNQKAIYAHQSDQITLEKIKEMEPLAIRPSRVSTDKLLISPKTNVDQVTAWTENKLIIRGENLENLCKKLQRKYNMTFIFGDEGIKKNRFSGTLLDETIQQVLDAIKLSAPVDYLIDGKTVLIFSNKEKAEKYSEYLKKYRN